MPSAPLQVRAVAPRPRAPRPRPGSPGTREVARARPVTSPLVMSPATCACCNAVGLRPELLVRCERRLHGRGRCVGDGVVERRPASDTGNERYSAITSCSVTVGTARNRSRQWPGSASPLLLNRSSASTSPVPTSWPGSAARSVKASLSLPISPSVDCRMCSYCSVSLSSRCLSNINS